MTTLTTIPTVISEASLWTTFVTFQLNKHLRVIRLLLLSFIMLCCVLLIFRPILNAQSENPLPPLSDLVVSKLKTIAMIGEARANNRYVFAKVGDSITVSDHFLNPIGDGIYQLGDHTYLQPVINAFLQTPVREGNSFNNPSVAAVVGWAAFSALSPRVADLYQCQVGESPLVCEYRIIQPTIAFIMFGTNDTGYRTDDEYRHDMQTIIDRSMERGIIPVLSTIPPLPRRMDRVSAFNTILRDMAAANDLPIIDLAAALAGLPNDGLAWDNIHPSWPSADEDQSAYFTAENLRYGYTVRNLLTLQMLDRIWHVLKPDPERAL